MRHNNCVTRTLCTIPTQTHQLRTCNVACICMQPYLFTFAAAETAPEAVWVVRQTKLKHVCISPQTVFRNHDCLRTQTCL